MDNSPPFVRPRCCVSTLVGFFFVVLGCCFAMPTTAQAQDEIVTPSETQYKLYQEGAEAFQAGQYDKAVDLFRASLRLGELNITYLNLGRSLFRLGKCKEASEAYAKALTSSKIANPTPMQVLQKVEKYRDELTQGCPSSVVVECSENSAEIYVNAMGPLPCDGSPVTLLPGDHVVRGSHNGIEDSHEFSLRPMEQVTVKLAFANKTDNDNTTPETPRADFRLGAGLLLLLSGGANPSGKRGDDPITEVDSELGDDSVYALSAHGLYRVFDQLHVGLGVRFFPAYKLDDDIDTLIGTASAAGLGLDITNNVKEFDFNLLLAYFLSFGSIEPYAFFEGGLAMLTGENLDENFLGYTFGFGGGVSWSLSPSFALYSNILFQLYNTSAEFQVPSTSENPGVEDLPGIIFGNPDPLTLSVNGTRLMLVIGADFQL